MDMMVTKRRPARSVVRSAVRPGDGPRVLPHPRVFVGLPSGVNSWLYFLNPPVRSNKHDSGQPSALSNSIASPSARARQTPDDELLVFTRELRSPRSRTPAPAAGRSGSCPRRGRSPRPPRAARRTPSKCARPGTRDPAAASPKSNESASWTEMEAARVTAPNGRGGMAERASLARVEMCVQCSRARALLSCEGTDAREAMCLRVR